MATPKVTVVGAGIGGLVSALELAARGLDVTVVERAERPGGKLRELNVGGHPMDAGPTVFTMRWVFEALFDSVGSSLSTHLDLRPASVLARHAWRQDQRLDLFADVHRSADAIGSFAGARASHGYLAFCDRARRIYSTLEEPFLRASRPNPVSLASRVGLRGLPDLMRISPMSTMWDELGRYFPDPRLRQLFGRYATYCGSSPFHAPATLMLIAHVEQDGVWTVEGGMHGIAKALESLAKHHGASFRYGSTVESILTRGGRAAGVRVAGGEEWAADAIVFNGDTAALACGMLGDAAAGSVPTTAPARRSLSALTWNVLAQTTGFPLSHHSVFFSGNSEFEFDELFKHGQLPLDPTVYVCAQDRAGTESASSIGSERLLLIVNAPARGDSANPFTDEELSRCEANAFRSMARCGLQVHRRLEHTTRTGPKDFENMVPATGGSLYGPASHGWAASFSRPGARSRLPGLYLAGGSVHPGPGVPMAALSGRQAAASVMEDLPRIRSMPPPSTAKSPPVAMPGGTSMH
jgi:1-hydroxycarotenoid 3,4-desaturase